MYVTCPFCSQTSLGLVFQQTFRTYFVTVFLEKRVDLGQSIVTVSAGGNFASKLEFVLWVTSWSFKASINPTSPPYMHPLLLELLVKYHSTNSVVNGCLVPGAHILAYPGFPNSAADLADRGM